MPLTIDSQSRAKSHSRAGSAPFELVMVTPVLMAMFVLVLYIGNFMIGQAYVVADARNQAWHKRYTEAKSKEYDFTGERGFVDAESTQERRISALVQGFPNPKSRHIVIGDSWHARLNDPLLHSGQRVQELNSHWNSKTQIELAKLAGVDAIDGAISDLTNLANIGDQIQNMILEFIGSKLDVLNDLLGSFQSDSDDYSKELEEKRTAEIKRLQERIKVLDAEIADLKLQIQAKKDRIKTIDEQIAKSNQLDDDDENKLSEEEIDDLEKERSRIEDEEIPALEEELEKREKEREAQQGLLDELK